ncbi:MAG: hypothetical protein ACRDQ5_09610 [Sciscionella sp.]
MGRLDRFRRRGSQDAAAAQPTPPPRWPDWDGGWYRAAAPRTIIQRAEMRVSDGLRFRSGLAAWQNPSFGGRLGHAVGPTAPSGLLNDVLRAPRQGEFATGGPLLLVSRPARELQDAPTPPGTAGLSSVDEQVTVQRASAAKPTVPRTMASAQDGATVRPRPIGASLVVARRPSMSPRPLRAITPVVQRRQAGSAPAVEPARASAWPHAVQPTVLSTGTAHTVGAPAVARGADTDADTDTTPPGDVPSHRAGAAPEHGGTVRAPLGEPLREVPAGAVVLSGVNPPVRHRVSADGVDDPMPVIQQEAAPARNEPTPRAPSTPSSEPETGHHQRPRPGIGAPIAQLPPTAHRPGQPHPPPGTGAAGFATDTGTASLLGAENHALGSHVRGSTDPTPATSVKRGTSMSIVDSEPVVMRAAPPASAAADPPQDTAGRTAAQAQPISRPATPPATVTTPTPPSAQPVRAAGGSAIPVAPSVQGASTSAGGGMPTVQRSMHTVQGRTTAATIPAATGTSDAAAVEPTTRESTSVRRGASSPASATPENGRARAPAGPASNPGVAVPAMPSNAVSSNAAQDTAMQRVRPLLADRPLTVGTGAGETFSLPAKATGRAGRPVVQTRRRRDDERRPDPSGARVPGSGRAVPGMRGTRQVVQRLASGDTASGGTASGNTASGDTARVATVRPTATGTAGPAPRLTVADPALPPTPHGVVPANTVPPTAGMPTAGMPAVGPLPVRPVQRVGPVRTEPERPATAGGGATSGVRPAGTDPIAGVPVTAVPARRPEGVVPGGDARETGTVGGVELDELARRLLEPVGRLLRADLRQGRERAGRLYDGRR